MSSRFVIFLVALVSSLPLANAAPVIPIMIHEVDDSTVAGNLISVHDGAITIEVKPQKGPSTRKTIDLSDISQTFFHDPPVRPRPASAIKPSTQPTTRPADTIDWRFKLIGGDHFTVKITHWSDQSITIKSDRLATHALKLPADQLRELWCGPPDAVKKSLALAIAPDSDDIAYVQSAENVVTVKGAALGIAADDLQFRYSGEVRKISLAKLIGIAFAPKPRATSNQFLQLINLDSGDAISGQWIGLAKNTLELRTPWGESTSIPVPQVSSIDSKNGRLVYLSDLTPSKVEQTPFFNRVIPFRLDAGLDGGALTLSDGKYPKGIAMHARCILQYNLNANFTRFRAKVGLEQPAGHLGRTIVRLLADNKTLYENPDTRGDQPPHDLDLDITSANHLTLEADFGPSQDTGARVIWANARLLRAKTTSP
jgi:hypothetical protein